MGANCQVNEKLTKHIVQLNIDKNDHLKKIASLVILLKVRKFKVILMESPLGCIT